MIRFNRNCSAIWKPNKYGARKVLIGENVFDSSKEAGRFMELKRKEGAGLISDLKLQPKFLLQEGFKKDSEHYKPIYYIADFEYIKDGKKIIEDVKGFKTDVYKIKKKLLLKKYPDIYFLET